MSDPRSQRAHGLYVRVYQSLFEHRKTLRAAGLLRVSVELLVGHLVRLWTWALHNASPSGLVPGGTCEELALAARWAGSPADFEAALLLVGFIERGADGFRVHGWEEMSGRVLAERASEASRWHRRQERRDATPEGASPSGHSSSPPPEHGGEGGAYSGGDSGGVPVEPRVEHRRKYIRVSASKEAEGAAASPKPATPAVLLFPCVGREKEWPLTEEFCRELQGHYPDLDVRRELRKVHDKIRRGAITRKTARGMARACYTWLDLAVRFGSARHAPGPDDGRGHDPTPPEPRELQDEEGHFGGDPQWMTYLLEVEQGRVAAGTFVAWKQSRCQ